jgi:hypothetical protein
MQPLYATPLPNAQTSPEFPSSGNSPLMDLFMSVSLEFTKAPYYRTRHPSAMYTHHRLVLAHAQASQQPEIGIATLRMRTNDPRPSCECTSAYCDADPGEYLQGSTRYHSYRTRHILLVRSQPRGDRSATIVCSRYILSNRRSDTSLAIGPPSSFVETHTTSRTYLVPVHYKMYTTSTYFVPLKAAAHFHVRSCVSTDVSPCVPGLSSDHVGRFLSSMHLRRHKLRKILFKILLLKSPCLSHVMEPAYFLVGSVGGVDPGAAILPNRCEVSVTTNLGTLTA